jgi:cyclophilin family peptidyl-prolyl cis-trans isomerase/HEAT repeat protein
MGVKKWALFLLVVCVYFRQYSQPISLQEREILQLQDQRSLGLGKLPACLQDQNSQIRFKAAIALANLQDTSVISALSKSLIDREKEVRVASAFALGQIGTERSAAILLSALSTEIDTAVIAGILEALGKFGSQKCLDSLLTIGEMDSLKFPDIDFSMCIARFAIRQIRTERSIWKCFAQVTSESPDQISINLFALWRSAPNGLIDIEIAKHKDVLLSLAFNPHTAVRMHLATLLGRSKSRDSREILDTLESVERTLNDWHVLVQIIRARAAVSTQTEQKIPPCIEYLASKNDHVKITALQVLKAFPSLQAEQPHVLDSLRVTLLDIVQDDSEHEAVRGEACVTLGKFFPKELPSVRSRFKDSQLGPRLKAKYLEGIGQQITREHLDEMRQNLNHESSRVAMAAWDFIRPMINPVVLNKIGLDSNESAALTRDMVRESNRALAKKDMGVTTVIANLFADTVVFKSFQRLGFSAEIAASLCSAFRNLSHSDDTETKQSIIQALGTMHDTTVVPFLEGELLNSDRSIAAEAAASLFHLTGRDYSNKVHPQKIPQRSDEDWTMLEGIKPHQRVRMATNRGEITLELMKDHAPFTVLNFVKLVKNKFYDGLSFHRVVADFVVQGGDPRGDGWGGPGYSMRTEISTVKYEQGSCGMASAGKDTEGSQFFITHVPTPHLDGRYTIFAKVVQGMEVVDRLQIGDTIITTRLAEE